MGDETFCSCVDYTGKDYQACRVACLSASGFSYHLFRLGLIEAEKAGITDEIHQRLYAAGYVKARQETLHKKTG
jgi:hypothetical protein